MTFGEIKIYDTFKTFDEPSSIFMKDVDCYDGAINAYKISDQFHIKMLDPVIFSKDYEINTAR